MTPPKRVRKRYLTEVERGYVTDAALGLSAKESARKRGVSVHTVHTGLVRAKKALGAINIVNAAALALLYEEIPDWDILTGKETR